MRWGRSILLGIFFLAGGTLLGTFFLVGCAKVQFSDGWVPDVHISTILCRTYL
jgi:hypothetical protein